MEQSGRKLIWSDEFDYQGPPDPAKWDYDRGGDGWGNLEKQYYTDAGNAWADGEKLIIEARREACGGNDYTSARLVTRGRAEWRYGRFEIRAKLPKGRGTWPAIWMLASDDSMGWPECGEIDIMEHVGYDPGAVHFTIHTGRYNHVQKTDKGQGMNLLDADEAFHTYTLDWRPDALRFSVDGAEQFVYDPRAFTEHPTGAEWPFNKPFFLILNIAVGGTWGGFKGVDEDAFPARMEIDFVRVYEYTAEEESA